MNPLVAVLLASWCVAAIVEILERKGLRLKGKG
jgi:hypothetical protein